MPQWKSNKDSRNGLRGSIPHREQCNNAVFSLFNFIIMAIYAESKGLTPKELLPAGVHIARCYQMIMLGTIDDVYQNVPKINDKIVISWEFPNELREFTLGKGLEPFVLSKDFTLSLSEKANLTSFLNAWRGVPFTKEESDRFNVAVLIDKCCMLNITHKPSKKDPTKSYAEILSVMPLPKGTIVPPAINPQIEFSANDFDWDIYNSFPKFIQEKIQKSRQFKALGDEIKVDTSAEFNQDPANSDLISQSEQFPF